MSNDWDVHTLEMPPESWIRVNWLHSSFTHLNSMSITLVIHSPLSIEQFCRSKLPKLWSYRHYRYRFSIHFQTRFSLWCYLLRAQLIHHFGTLRRSNERIFIGIVGLTMKRYRCSNQSLLLFLRVFMFSLYFSFDSSFFIIGISYIFDWHHLFVSILFANVCLTLVFFWFMFVDFLLSFRVLQVYMFLVEKHLCVTLWAKIEIFDWVRFLAFDHIEPLYSILVFFFFLVVDNKAISKSYKPLNEFIFDPLRLLWHNVTDLNEVEFETKYLFMDFARFTNDD